MSARTTADELRDSAKEHIKLSIKDLLIFSDEDTYGTTEYQQIYRNKVLQLILQLKSIKDSL